MSCLLSKGLHLTLTVYLPTTASTTSSAASSKQPPFLPLVTSTAAGGSSSRSGSPSTLSPASSNSLPSVSRPQNLKLPQSHSLNAFPNKASGAEAPDDLNRLIFFFDVMSTQEKIAKVFTNWVFSKHKRIQIFPCFPV